MTSEFDLQRSLDGGIIRPDIVMYHGGRIVGPVELRTNSKRMAYGPGFYLTTSYWTARDYRGGGGSVYRVLISGDLRWAHRVRLSMGKIEAFLDSIPKLKNRKKILDDLHRLAEQQRERHSGTVSFVGISNTIDNFNGYGPKVAREVARAMVEFGCDATYVQNANGGNEDWIALHNVVKVRDIEKLSGPAEDFPRLKVD